MTLAQEYSYGQRGRIEAEINRLEEERKLARQRGEMVDAHNLLHQIHEYERELEQATRDPRRQS